MKIISKTILTKVNKLNDLIKINSDHFNNDIVEETPTVTTFTDYSIAPKLILFYQGKKDAIMTILMYSILITKALNNINTET